MKNDIVKGFKLTLNFHTENITKEQCNKIIIQVENSLSNSMHYNEDILGVCLGNVKAEFIEINEEGD